jgi:hypothetical protein
MTLAQERGEGLHMTGCGVGGVFWTSTGVILVLYILLVIVLRAGIF